MIYCAHKQSSSSGSNLWLVSSWSISPWTCRGLLIHCHYHHNINIDMHLSCLFPSLRTMFPVHCFNFGSCMTLLNCTYMPYMPSTLLAHCSVINLYRDSNAYKNLWNDHSLWPSFLIWWLQYHFLTEVAAPTKLGLCLPYLWHGKLGRSKWYLDFVINF